MALLYTLYVNEEFLVRVCCSVLSIRKVEVETNNNHTRRDIYNVIAVLRGSVERGGLPCAYYNVNRSVCMGSVEPGGCPVHTITSLTSVEPGGSSCATDVTVQVARKS